MAEIINDITIQLFKDILLNNVVEDVTSGMGKLANDYNIDHLEYQELIPAMLSASMTIKNNKVIICQASMENIDKECYEQMKTDNVEDISISLEEYNDIIDSLGIDKTSSIFGDDVRFYDWYRKSNDSDLAVLKDREDYSEDTVIDDENPFISDEQSDN